MRVNLTHADAVRFFAELYCGEHHIPAPGMCGAHGVRRYGGGDGWYVNHYGDLSTFDFDKLTRLVFLAHDRCVRATVENGGPRMVKITIWNRDEREGEIWSRHPTLEAAIETWRKHNHESPLMDFDPLPPHMRSNDPIGNAGKLEYAAKRASRQQKAS